ncbi:unnamed protein product [Brassicogethes aeneus]|uniref:C2H2-type domain-containing protein n=1 Tax=Brassicogethes aeneus TaxID=1431903 RepID=A0A9P0BH15_BRAAE|nr:unnamed protein product [Brassicogethes aeneus]
MSNLGDLYKDLFVEYKKGKKPSVAQKEFNELWADTKQKHTTKEDFKKWASNLLVEYRRKNQATKSSNILYYYSSSRKVVVFTANIIYFQSDSENVPINLTVLPIEQSRTLCPSKLDCTKTIQVKENDTNQTTSGALKRKGQAAECGDEDTTNAPSVSTSTVQPVRATPAQDKLNNQIALLQGELDLLIRRRDSLSADGEEQRQLKKLRDKIDRCKKILRKKEQHMRHSKKHRLSIKSKIALACRDSPNVANLFKVRSTAGRPRLEEEQPELLKTIVDLAMFGASAEERRRSEIVRSCRTLTDLHDKLKEHGFKISRNGTYLRLLPKNYSTLEGKRHVVTVPVKLSRPEADHHKAHPDQHFCVATIRSLETVASILGPDQVFFLSQDDKARVPIGLTAANKQGPLLMHVEYRVSLPDHDWVIAAKHKLIPSVYAGCIIKANDMGRPEAITYSGPTYVAVRSGKHSSSTALSHSVDFNRLATLDTFKEIMRNEEGNLKPVVLISSDGGPDENPRYAKVISHAVNHFVEHDLDAIFVFTNAPGRSAFNRVERRMAPLSRELSGLILPHDYYGSHLNAQGKTIDPNLEKNNFQKAGEVLAEVWNSMVIDGHDVVAEYIEPNDSAERLIPDRPSPQWYSEHVRESQYLLQSSCGPCIPKPEEHDGKQFAPFLLRQSLSITPTHEGFDKLPYDLYCPSLKDERQQLVGRICKRCGLYFCTKKNAQAHSISLHSRTSELLNISTETQKVCPIRIITRRSVASKDILCVVRENDDAEWLDEDDIYLSDLRLKEVPTAEQDACSLVTLENNQANIWPEESFI